MRSPVPRRLPAALLAPVVLAPALLASAAAARAQAGTAPATARVSGRVVDRTAGTGIPRATLVVHGAAAGDSAGARDSAGTTVADSVGRFVLAGLPAGPRRLVVSAPGWVPRTLAIELHPGDDLQWTVALDSTAAAREAHAQALAPVTVTAPAAPRPSYRLVDFERRRRTGRGHFLGEEEITRLAAGRLADLTRGMRGVSQECGPGGCRIRMVRAQPNCPPQYVVDGRVENMFGPTTPPQDVVGLEVYTGPSDVPAEFSGPDAACGVVVIWTRSGPRAR